LYQQNENDMKNIKRISAPKFKVGRFVLNEYELRQLMLDVANGNEAAGIKVKDSTGKVVEILEDGHLSGCIKGLDVADSLAMELHRLRRKKAFI
jgi:hypothetical protein